MNVSKILEEIKKLYPDSWVDVKMSSIHGKRIGNNPKGIIVDEEANTILKEIKISLQYSAPVINVCIVHPGCNRWANSQIIRSVPFYCKYCGKQPLTEANAEMLGLPIKPTVAKMQIRVMGPNGYEYSGDKRFEVSNMILCGDNQWWHQCKEGPVNKFETSRLTIKKFPHKCKNCKMLIGAASFNFKSAFKLPSLV